MCYIKTSGLLPCILNDVCGLYDGFKAQVYCAPLKSLLLVWKGIMGNFGYHIKMYKLHRIPFNSF